MTTDPAGTSGAFPARQSAIRPELRIMMRSMHFVLVAGLVLEVSTARACDCAGRLDEKTSDLVFVGTVESSSSHGGPGDNAKKIRYTFKVEDTVKGPRSNSVFVYTGNNDCGFFFSKGKRYTVYASRSLDSPKDWSVSSCSLTSEHQK